MTQEEKVKAYDEALEKARKELQTCGSLDCDAARQIFRFFPALKESEDERIRKNIITYLKQRKDRSSSIPAAIGSWIAWLEKQGEQKPAWSEKDERMLCDVISYAEHEISFKNTPQLNWLKSLKERYTWKPSDEQMEALHDLNLTGNISYAGQGQVLIELYNDLKKLKG